MTRVGKRRGSVDLKGKCRLDVCGGCGAVPGRVDSGRSRGVSFSNMKTITNAQRREKEHRLLVALETTGFRV